MAEPAKKTAAKKTAASKGTSKRKVLTPEERIQKAEAELEKLRSQASERNVKTLVTLYTQRDQVQAKVDTLNERIDSIKEQISDVEGRTDNEQVKAAKDARAALVEQDEATAARDKANAEAPNEATHFGASATDS